ncbi:helicase [Massilia sp. PDC64]|nr:helicase [Massilia sp. PDC64]
MSNLPVSVKFLDSAASSAAKARGVEPALPTEDPLDVATALKCINAFQVRVNIKALEALDDERNAQPLVAAARILQSTAQHLRREKRANSADLDELSFHAAVAFAMHGNFPSARAALSDVSSDFIEDSLVFRMVAAICDPCHDSVRHRSADSEFEPFRLQWYRALRNASSQVRATSFDSALTFFTTAARAGIMAEGALLLGGRMAAHQARRLATANLLDDAPEIPDWFIRNSIRAGMVTLLPPQHVLLSKERIAGHGRNTLLTLPTSTGKTFVAEACIASGLADNGLCVYVAPYVAVGEQVKDSLRKRLGNEATSISMFGGFQSEGLSVFAEKEVVVATPERFDGWLRSGENLERLRTVVFDEIHILENGVRGARVEGLVSRLRLLQRSNPNLRIIGLSAVLTKPQRVCRWLGVEEKDLHEIGWRPTARRLAMCLANGDMHWIHGNDALRPQQDEAISPLSKPVKIKLPGQIKPARFPKPNEKSASENVAAIARDFLARLGSPGLIVCPRKLDTRLLARELISGRELVKNDDVLQTADNILTRYPYLDFLAGCLRYGVAYHNASLPFDVRREIERLTRARALFVVCATTTLAEGADLPFRWTVVSHWLSSMYGDGTPMKSMTFRNIAGRCGRAGAFSEGDTVLFQNLMGPPSTSRQRNTHSLEKVMFSSLPLQSTLGGEWAETSEHQQKFIEATFSAQLLACIREHPEAEDIVSDLSDASYAGQTDGEDNVRRILSATVNSILDDQRVGGAMAVMNSPIKLTPFGQAANLSGFSPETCRQMVEFLSSETFESGPTLYAELLKRFNNIPEQADDTLRKIFSGASHKNVVKADNLQKMLENLLLGSDLRDVFEQLRSKTSKAQPETVEKMFEDFVPFINGVVGTFLPWILRGLEKLCAYGSDRASITNWSNMAKELEAALRAKGGETAPDDLLVPDE